MVREEPVTYDGGRGQHSLVDQLIDDINAEVVTLSASNVSHRVMGAESLSIPSCL